MRRRILEMIGLDGDDMALKYKTGESVSDGLSTLIIEHGLGEVPFLFAIVTDVTGEEEDGTTAAMFLNTGLTTRYTSTVSKQWSEVGNTIVTDGVNAVQNVSPSSASYGIYSVDENEIKIFRYASNKNFISGKTYKWIAIADWRS